MVKTHTGKTSSLRLVGCISDQFPTRGTPRQVSASHSKSPPRTASIYLTRQVRSQLVRGPRRTTVTPQPTRMEERISTSCRYNN
jgi:hypothetical protein